jgi:hypothetical protein
MRDQEDLFPGDGDKPQGIDMAAGIVREPIGRKRALSALDGTRTFEPATSFFEFFEFFEVCDAPEDLVRLTWNVPIRREPTVDSRTVTKGDRRTAGRAPINQRAGPEGHAGTAQRSRRRRRAACQRCAGEVGTGRENRAPCPSWLYR